MPASTNNVAPIDENVTIPPAIRAAAARAKALHEQVYTAPPAEPAEPEILLPAPEAASPPVVTTPDTPAPVAPTPPAADSWEHKYNSMKGRHDRLEGIIRTQNDRMAGLENTIAAMQVAHVPTPVLTPAEVPQLTPEEIKDYGEDFLNVVGRKARESISPEVAALKATVENLQSRIDNTTSYVAQNERTKMQTSLTEALPNWREINRSENFLNWLALPDTYSGVTRHDLLKKVYAANDTPRVLAFFQGFLSEEAAVAPQTTAPDLAPTKIPLESLAAPGRAKTAATSVPAEKPSFTRAQVSQFYVDVANGKYRGRDEDKNRLEQQIHAAGQEGRLI